MLYRRGSQWDMYPYKVKYIQHGEEREQWALPSKEWWIDFANVWDHTEIVEFVKIELSADQLNRLEEIRSMPEDFADVYTNYILDGVFPDEFPNTHPFMLIQTKKVNEELEAENILLKAQNNALVERTDFHEEVLTEIILVINP